MNLLRQVLWLLLFLSPWRIETVYAQETEAKSKFVYTFLKFIKFTAKQHAGDLTICLLNRTESRGAFSRLDGQRLGAAKIKTLALRTVELTSPCEVIYVDASLSHQEQSILRVIRGKGILTIGESSSFLAQGGIVYVWTQNERIRFNINLTAAQAEGFNLSSQVLKLASEVITEKASV